MPKSHLKILLLKANVFKTQPDSRLKRLFGAVLSIPSVPEWGIDKHFRLKQDEFFLKIKCSLGQRVSCTKTLQAEKCYLQKKE